MLLPARIRTFLFHLKHFPWLVVSPIVVVAVMVTALVGWQIYVNQQLQHQVSHLTDQNQKQLYEAHLQALQQIAITSQKTAVEKSLDELKSDASKERQLKLDEVFTQFKAVQTQVDRNKGVKLDTSGTTNLYNEWGNDLLAEKFDVVLTKMADATTSLNKQYQTYVAALPTATPRPVVVSQQSTGGDAAGYSRTTVSTSRGSFGVSLIKLKLSEYTVKTVSANTANCTNQCPAKSLAQYISENGAYAGINGTYFCPPDYSTCAGKTYSYDFAFYNSNIGSWLNAPALHWDTEGLATFSGHSAQFYRRAMDYDGHAVTAGIANFPPLLVQNGQVITNASDQTGAQQTKSTRGILAVDGTYIYLAQVSSASLVDAAYVMQALGAKDVFNLDGGGSSALYINGAYKVGPGRSLPNALVLIRG